MPARPTIETGTSKYAQLSQNPFTGGLRLVISPLPGEPMEAANQRNWKMLRVEPLTLGYSPQMIGPYLARFGKKLDAPRPGGIAAAILPAAYLPCRNESPPGAKRTGKDLLRLHVMQVKPVVTPPAKHATNRP